MNKEYRSIIKKSAIMKIDNKIYICEKKISSRFNISEAFLRKNRLKETRKDKIIPFHRFLGRILYIEEEVEEWIKNNIKNNNYL